MVAILLVVTACSREVTVDEPAEEVLASVEGVDRSVLESLPPGVTVEMLERGRELYVVCSVCHGLDGRGTQLGPSLRDSEWLHITGEIAEIQEIVRTGVPTPRQYLVPMPVLGGADLDDDGLRAVAAYVYALARSES